MSKDEIKDRFKKTKLGKKIFKRFKVTIILFVIMHILMLVSLVLFVPNVKNIISGNISLFTILISLALFISALMSFIFSIMLIYYDGKINGCVELFDLMLKVKKKKGDSDE